MLSISLTPAGCQPNEDAKRNRDILLADSRKAIAAQNLDLRSYWTSVYGADGLARAEEALEKLLYDMAPGSCAEGVEFDGTYPVKYARGKMDLYYPDIVIRNRARKAMMGVLGGCVNFLLKDLTRRKIVECIRLGVGNRAHYRMPMRFELTEAALEEIASSIQVDDVGILGVDNAQAFDDNSAMPEANTCSIEYRGYDNPEDLDPLADGVTWAPGRGYHRIDGDCRMEEVAA